MACPISGRALCSLLAQARQLVSGSFFVLNTLLFLHLMTFNLGSWVMVYLERR